MEKFYAIKVRCPIKFDCFKVNEHIYYCPDMQMDFFRHDNGTYSCLKNIRPELDKRMHDLRRVPFWETGRCLVDGEVLTADEYCL